MKTSNFRRSASLLGAVSIARGTPKWFQGQRYLALAPSWSLIAVGKRGDHEEYERRYLEEVLGPLDAERVSAELEALVAPHEPVLLCWEKPGEFCHRRLVARWLSSELGIDVPEASQ